MTTRPASESQDRLKARVDLATAAEQLNLKVDAAQLESLLALAEILHTWGTRINLTGHKTFAAIVHGMVVESAALASELPVIRSLADLGSGAGFPGLPIAILQPKCRITLVEAREKRHHFQKAVIRDLGLDNVSPLRGRAENLIPIPHEAAIAQAMAQPEQALSSMLPWVEDGGLILIPGSSTPPSLAPQQGIIFERPARYRVPLSERDRTLWIGRRVN